MQFREGDSVMHWVYGLGQVIRLEERALSGEKTLYYAVQVRDLTVWVPADVKLESRLRPPTPMAGFKRLLSILTGPGEPLPDDRHQRKLMLMDLLKEGRAESLCRVIRDLSGYRRNKSLNDSDQALLKRTQNALIGEWGFSLSIPQAQAELELQKILATHAA